MKVVYSASIISIVSIYQSILAGHGIRCWIRNEFLSAGMGELPPIECWPQLCVEDEDFEDAERIIAEALTEKVFEAWKCPSCGEEIEGQFSACWKCGTSPP
jgi:hypothetical protein